MPLIVNDVFTIGVRGSREVEDYREGKGGEGKLAAKPLQFCDRSLLFY